MSLLRRFVWWLRAGRKEDEVREELQFHLDQETRERRDRGLPEDEARWAARRDLGNEARVREDARAIWTWRPLDELAQDFRYACRTLFKNPAVSVFVMLSLALGIGASTAIYSFMDALLIRSLPVPDPRSLVVMTWQSGPIDSRAAGRESTFVLRSIDGSIHAREGGREARIFPYQAFERLHQVSAPVLSSTFAFFSAGNMNVMVNGHAELSPVQYVSAEFFTGVAAPASAGRLLIADDHRPGAPPAAVIGAGYAARRFGSAANAVGAPILINNVPFTVVGVSAADFFGVDPGGATSVYLPMRAHLVLDPAEAKRYTDPHFYWAGIMGRLRPGVTLAGAESVLAPAFHQWVAPTAATDRERANLPVLRLSEGAGGLDTLRRRYAQPLYLLLAMVGVILAIACANAANLLLARANARRREIAVRLSIGAGRFRLIRQLLTESIVLSLLSGAIGVVIALAGTRLLTVLLANGDTAFTLDASLNWNVLAVTLGLSLLCGMLFGLAPALQATRPQLTPALKDGGAALSRARSGRVPRLKLQQALVVVQISLLMVLLVSAGLFVRTLAKLQAIPLGFNPDKLLLFEINAPQAGHPAANAANLYADIQRRLADIPGARAVTLAHASLIRAGRGHPVFVDGVVARDTRLLQIGPRFFSTMQISMLAGREIDDRDRAGALPVAVISDLFARNFFPDQNPIGRPIRIFFGGTRPGSPPPMDVEVVGVAASVRYGPLKNVIPPVLYVSYAQIPTRQLQQMTYIIRTDGDPMDLASTVRPIVHAADSRVPVTNLKTQQGDIDQTINQEIVLARLATTFAAVALVIACVGLYGTMAYAVARRTREIGIRMALGARRTVVTWMVLREVIALTVLGLLLSIPMARGAARFVASLLFEMQPNDPRAVAAAVATLLLAAAAAAYAPARRATRIDPTAALRDE
jgi:predicted permease